MKNSPLPLSIFIIAKNESARIHHTLKSIQGLATEIIVVDSGSTDGTQEICEKYGARVIFHPWEGYGPQKRFAESECKELWRFNLDADEEVTPELAAEIRALFQPEPPKKIYKMRFVMLHRTRKKPGKFAPFTTYIRLYHRDFASFHDSKIHDVAVPKNQNEPTATLKNIVLHRCFLSYSHAIEKINFYTNMQAEDFIKSGRKISTTRIIFEPFTAFLKAYFIRRYIFLGLEGFIESTIYAFARTLRLAKAYEASAIQNKKA